MKLIGKGLFSKVYQLNENQVFIKSECYVKECLSLFTDAKHFPKLERIDYQEYVCEYYPKVKSLKSELCENDYKVYQELRKLDTHTTNAYDGLDKCRSEFEKITNDSFRESLLEVLDDLSNYGSDIRFEISPRNVAVKDGKLILLDVFFIQSQANEIRKNKKQYAY